MREQNKQGRYQELAKKWRDGQISPAEKKEFDNWYNSFDDTLLSSERPITERELGERLYQSILAKEYINPARVISMVFWKRLAVASCILVIIGAGGWLLLKKDNPLSTAAYIKPGGNKAILTLANGRQIVLTGAANGMIARENNTEIIKHADGQVTYGPAGSGKDNGKRMNVMSTPRGGQYWVSLADGSKVLLNAASSLRYPVSFSGKERKVELTGEAYFEVAKDKEHPFIVQTAQQTVQVLGTHFDVNSYPDEPADKTTLFEGSVKISDKAGVHQGMLKPGEQSVMTSAELKISLTDTEEVLAWKNGYFMYESEPIESVMRKISRWYDVDVVYEGAKPTDRFGGTVSRFANVSQVLNKLALTKKVRFRIEERRIIVSR